MHFHRLPITTVGILLATILSCNTSAQKNDRYSAAIEEKIKHVENNLGTGIELKNAKGKVKGFYFKDGGEKISAKKL
jgi:cytochrome oxidase Cu insertion factor (SCO1/SenC/PrrC family)